MTKQKTFTFRYKKIKLVEKGYIFTRYISAKEAFKAELLKQGYLVRNFKEREMIEITCEAARANYSLKERIKLQKQIDT